MCIHVHAADHTTAVSTAIGIHQVKYAALRLCTGLPVDRLSEDDAVFFADLATLIRGRLEEARSQPPCGLSPE